MSVKKPEVSPGGSRVIRHEGREREWTVPAEIGAMEAIERHFTKHFGEPNLVFHEIVSDLVHIDVHVIPPSEHRNCFTLFTTGMSDRPMTAPREAADSRFAELILSLPPDWRIDLLQTTPPPGDLERWYWPIRWLKKLARFPHEYETWLGFGHTLPNGDPPEAFTPDTRMCAWMLLPPVSVPSEGRVVTTDDGRTIKLYALHALHREELSAKLNKGVDALLESFDRAKVSETLDPTRPSSVRKKLFGIF